MSTVTVRFPEAGRLARLHVLLRLLLLLAVAHVAGALGWPGILVIGVPAAAALRISQVGGRAYLEQDARSATQLLRWLVAFYAYLGLVTDRFPWSLDDDVVELHVTPTGTPTLGSALLRLLTAIPAGIAVWVFGLVGVLVWLLAALFVLVDEHYPHALYAYQCGVLRMQAHFLAYLASLVDEYPPLLPVTGGSPVPPTAPAV